MSLTSHSGLIGYFLALLAASAAVTWLLLRRLRIIDQPNERSSHSTPTPRGGGLGIVLGFLLALLLIWLLEPALAGGLSTTSFIGFLLAVLLISAISLRDDVQPLNFRHRLLVQMLAALLLILSGDTLALQQISLLLGWPDSSSAPTWLLCSAGLIALLWLIGLTNAYNFMDGLDGMAAGTAVVVAAVFSLLCWQLHQPLPALLALALCAGSCGFLLFNWPPARIFMGDVGSTFLGFCFAALALLIATPDQPQLLLLMPLLLLHYLFDTVFTFCRRLLAGERVTQPHRSHLYQLLNRSGHSHRRVSLLYAGLAAVQGAAALWLVQPRPHPLHQAHPAQDGRWIFLLILLFLLAYSLAAWRIVRQARRSSLI